MPGQKNVWRIGWQTRTRGILPVVQHLDSIGHKGQHSIKILELLQFRFGAMGFTVYGTHLGLAGLLSFSENSRAKRLISDVLRYIPETSSTRSFPEQSILPERIAAIDVLVFIDRYGQILHIRIEKRESISIIPW